MNFENRHHFWLLFAIMALLLPALTINLSMPVMIDDEGIRSLVALEMQLSGNYITPTLHGEYYYKKPPLFNWFLVLSFQMFKVHNEWSARMPTVICLLGYATTVFFVYRRHLGSSKAMLLSLLLITCGRILFWDSMLALIDICFSWVVFSQFMIMYYFLRKDRWQELFLWSYFFTAVAFLLKGLPAVVFQAITLMVLFGYKKAWRRVYSLPHVLGGLIFLSMIGVYYGAYHQYNSLENIFSTLFNESSQRTVVKYGLGQTLRHLVSFPFEMVYHFLPWSLLVVYFFSKGVYSYLKSNEFIFINLLFFVANIVVYWTSPEVYPRYLLMFVPLLFAIFLFLQSRHELEKTWQFVGLQWIFGSAILLGAILAWLPFFLERTQQVPNLAIKTICLATSATILLVLYIRWPTQRMWTIVLFLLILRIEFNWFVIPDRNANDFGALCRESAISAGQRFSDEPLFLFRNSSMQFTSSFYLTGARGKIIKYKRGRLNPGDLIIVDPARYPRIKFKKLGQLYLRHGKRVFFIGRI